MNHFDFSWPMHRNVVRRADLLDRVMDTVGIVPVCAVRIDEGKAFYRARSRCVECAKAGECSAWLESAEGLSRPPGFCPNAEFFGRCGLRNEPPNVT